MEPWSLIDIQSEIHNTDGAHGILSFNTSFVRVSTLEEGSEPKTYPALDPDNVVISKNRSGYRQRVISPALR